jgi:hypothetical protein
VVGAVLVYRAISIWVLGLGGLSVASTRRASAIRRAVMSPSWSGGLHLAQATETGG